MNIPEIVDYMPESISTILDPVENKGGLFLGGIAALYKSTKKNNIKNAISLCENTQFDCSELELSNHLKILIEDSEAANIIQYFEQTNQFIHSNLQKGNVLVHCMAGVSRSAAVVIAYIMWSKNLKFQEAYLFVARKREVIYPNHGFRKQLQSYENKLFPKVQVQ